jgi:ADP-ribose pyrophosphatase
MSIKHTNPWKTLSRRTILDHGRFLKVEEDSIELPDGSVISDWPRVIIPDAVIILPRLVNGKFLVFRQTKYAVEGISLAPVGGMLEPGEEPISAAKRELLEEMGCEAAKWISFGSYVLDPNRGVASIHLFLAIDATQVTDPESDDLEEQELLILERSELEQALTTGEFKVLAWTTVVSLALNQLKE